MVNDGLAFITNLFTPNGFVGLINFLFVVIVLLYFLFALIVIRQVSLLNSSFKTSLAPLFMFLALVHLFASGVVMVISLLSL